MANEMSNREKRAWTAAYGAAFAVFTGRRISDASRLPLDVLVSDMLEDPDVRPAIAKAAVAVADHAVECLRAMPASARSRFK